MPRYRDRETGRIITVDGGEPSDEELDAMFADGGDTFRLRAASPERTSSVRPIPPGARPGMGQKVGDFLTGAAKGYGETMAQTMSPLALGPVGMAAKYAIGGSGTPEILQPTEAERPGYLAEGVAESIVPGARLAKSAVAGAPGMLRKVAGAAMGPVGGAAVGAGARYATGGDALDVAQAAITGAVTGAAGRRYAAGASRSLAARLKHMLGRAAKDEPAVARAAENIVIPEGRVIGNTGQSIAESQIARAAELARGAQRAAPAAVNIPAAATPRAAAASVEDAFKATIAREARQARVGGGLMPQATKAARSVPAPQAAKRASRPAKAKATTATASEEMTPLESQLKASVLPKEQMALEVERKVLALKTTHGLSNAQVAASLRELYGIPPTYGKKMVEMILQTHGLK